MNILFAHKINVLLQIFFIDTGDKKKLAYALAEGLIETFGDIRNFIGFKFKSQRFFDIRVSYSPVPPVQVIKKKTQRLAEKVAEAYRKGPENRA
jgi:hypothetical protein